MSQTISKDGTTLSYERSGQGPAVILVDGALCSRAFGPMPKLAPLLAPHFTVYVYDRRGRGQSGDTPPYSREREVEDIAALLQEASGSASLVGLSSGAALALHAAASGLAVTKVVAYEPPYVDEDGTKGGADHERRLQELVAAGDRAGAVKYFMRTMVGIPAPFVVMMQLMPWIWPKMKAVAPTLPYDAAVMTEFKVPAARFAEVRVPTLVMHGGKTDLRLQKAAEAVAKAVPGARHETLAGQTHNVKLTVLAPAVVGFLTT
jgi:pimeloyl-ACP methyl ester carboxylesterase